MSEYDTVVQAIEFVETRSGRARAILTLGGIKKLYNQRTDGIDDATLVHMLYRFKAEQELANVLVVPVAAAVEPIESDIIMTIKKPKKVRGAK